MKDNSLEVIAAEIMKGLPKSKLSASSRRLFRSYLRRFGDEIDEPILADEKEAPQYFIRVPIQIADSKNGDAFTVAMSPQAAEKILSRA